jgi:hypothetical protein
MMEAALADIHNDAEFALPGRDELTALDVRIVDAIVGVFTGNLSQEALENTGLTINELERKLLDENVGNVSKGCSVAFRTFCHFMKMVDDMPTKLSQRASDAVTSWFENWAVAMPRKSIEAAAEAAGLMVATIARNDDDAREFATTFTSRVIYLMSFVDKYVQ